MARGIAGIAGGLVAWIVVATIANLVLRFTWADYALVEKEMSFTLAMLLARLAIGAVSSVCAGATAAWLTKRHWRVVAILAGVLVAMFVPVHYELWTRFPLWYHAAFFATLIVMTLAGGAPYRRLAS